MHCIYWRLRLCKVRMKTKKPELVKTSPGFLYIKTILAQNTTAKIIHAVNGQDAIEKFLNNPDIDIILMDLKMPEINGLEATVKIKSLNKDIPVIAITAYAMMGDEKRILEAGCDSYISKPISKKALLDKIAEFITI